MYVYVCFMVSAAANSSSDTSMPMMMMETRQQNTEVRVSLSRISDKVDRLSEKVPMTTFPIAAVDFQYSSWHETELA